MKNDPTSAFKHQLVADSSVAQLLGMSSSWVRKQRFLRRKGLPHILNIEPVMIGKVPRYAEVEVHAWIDAKKAHTKTTSGE